MSKTSATNAGAVKAANSPAAARTAAAGNAGTGTSTRKIGAKRV
jgi:hypothetical protein